MVSINLKFLQQQQHKTDQASLWSSSSTGHVVELMRLAYCVELHHKLINEMFNCSELQNKHKQIQTVTTQHNFFINEPDMCRNMNSIISKQ